MFRVAITTTDPAIDTGMDAQVTIGDSMGGILISFDESVYGGSEGASVTVCLLIQSSNIIDAARGVVLRVSTESGTAEGNV